MSSSQPPSSPLVGVVHSRSRKVAAYWTAAWSVLFAAFLSLPAAREWVEDFSEEGSGVTPRWVYAVFLQCVLVSAFALLAAQIPDWSTLGALAVALLATTIAYAVGLGATIGASPDNRWVQWLELIEHAPGRQAARWCFVAVCLGMLLTYFSGRMAARWRWEEA